MKVGHAFWTGLVLAAIVVAAPANAAPRKAPLPTIVLVHGALIDGSSWRGGIVTATLTSAGSDDRVGNDTHLIRTSSFPA